MRYETDIRDEGMSVCTVAEMRALDQEAIARWGIPDLLLMENAGLAATDVLAREIGISGRRIALFCGAGNNGGDGFVVARQILSRGGEPHVFVLGDTRKLAVAARDHLEMLRRSTVPVQLLTSAREAENLIRSCDGIVDALFGTGLDRPVQGLCRDVIDAINAAGRPVISLDIPSGVNGDSGEILGTAIRARATVTFGMAKAGQFLYPGAACCGRLYLSRISFPPDLWRHQDPAMALNGWFPLPPRPHDAYKGRMGDVLFIAGAVGYYGAPFLSAYAFLKAGGGYARLAAPRSIVPFLAQKGCEIVFAPQEETGAGSLSGKNRENLLALAERADWVVLGPGVSLEEETQRLVRDLCAAVSKPLLIDGDGLTALAADTSILRERCAPTVLTPHAGEMARLMGRSVGEITGDRIGVLRHFCRATGAHVVWKGPHSLIGFPDERVFINLSGNAGMATAGAGDVLTGAIAAMAGLGLPLPEAVRKGVFLHGLAGDLAAETLGEDGLTAQDVLRHLPLAVKLDRAALPAPYGGRYAGWTIL